MANQKNGNSLSIDATGSVTTNPTRVAYIAFTPNAANDQLVLKDGSTSGAIKWTCKGATAEHTEFYDLSYSPLFFPNGIYVATLDASGVAILVTTTSGDKQ
jgi:hypothetical protein